MTRKRRERKGHVERKKVAFLPDHLEFAVIDDADAVEIGEVGAQRSGVDFRVLDDVHIELEIFGSDGDILPLLFRDGVGEVMPQNPIAELDADAEPVRGDVPRLRHLRKEFVEFVVCADAERIHDARHQRIAERGVVVEQIIHVLGIRRNRRDEAVAGNGFRIKELRVRHRDFRFRLLRDGGGRRAERSG